MNLITLRRNGMRLRGAAKGSAEIPGDKLVYKLGKCLYGNLINKSRGDKVYKFLGTDCDFCGPILHPRFLNMYNNAQQNKLNLVIAIKMDSMKNLAEVKKLNVLTKQKKTVKLCWSRSIMLVYFKLKTKQ